MHKPGKKLTIYADGSWMVSDFDVQENRIYFGPGIGFPQTAKEVAPQISFYVAEGGNAAIDDQRVQEVRS